MAEPASCDAGVGSFDRDTTVRRIALAPSVRAPASASGSARGAAYDAEISPAWRAGRGPHGGYLAAILLRALSDTVADPERSPRSLTIHFARRPKPGPVRIATVLERDGRSLHTLSARMEQQGSLIALALAAFSLPWSAPEMNEAQMAQVTPADAERRTAPALAARVEQGLAPMFLRQMVIQPRTGPMPFSGSQGPMEGGAWIGVADDQRPIDAIALALFSDALFSPPFVRMSELATSPTVDLSVHFRTRLPLPQGESPRRLCFGHFRSRLVHEGFFEEDGELWSAEGELLAQSRQLAILMPLAQRPARAPA